jgi:ParB family chromosome partitioning protein
MSVEKTDWESAEYEVRKIPVDRIEMGRFQARSSKVEEGLEDLADNIKKLGLLNPITVFERDDGIFELIAGQRRFLAIKDILEWSTIPARILPFEPGEVTAKAISLSENIMRQSLTNKDVENSIQLLYVRCGASASSISETLGIPYHIVLSVIKYEGLPEILKQEVDSGNVDIDLANRAAGASLRDDGTVDEEKASSVASVMKTLMPDQRKTLVKMAKGRPAATVEELADEARKIPRTKRFQITMLMDEFEALSEYAKTEEIDERDAASRVVVKSLKDMGFLTS